jgi:hypothetical protein
MIWDVHPAYRSRTRILTFLPIPDPRSGGQKGPQHCFLITGFSNRPCEIQAEYVHEVVDAAGAPHCVQATPLVHHNCLDVK